MSSLGIGIVGMGAMGRTHLDAWRSIDGVEVLGVVSSRSQKDVVVHATVESLLADGKVGLVSVCTPTDTHVPLVRQLLAAGCDVVCEKPLALTASEASALFSEAAAAGRMLAVGHVVRHFPQYTEVRRLLRSGTLGRAGTIRLRRAVPWPAGSRDWFSDEERSGGVVFDLMIHDLDFLAGEWGLPETVFAQRAEGPGVSVVTATLQFRGGVIAHVEALWGGVSELEYSCEVAGSQGTAGFSSRRSAGLVITGGAGSSTRHESPTIVDPYAAQLRHVLALRKEGAFHDGDRQAIETIAACEMIDRALRTGEAIAAEGTSTR